MNRATWLASQLLLCKKLWWTCVKFFVQVSCTSFWYKFLDHVSQALGYFSTTWTLAAKHSFESLSTSGSKLLLRENLQIYLHKCHMTRVHLKIEIQKLQVKSGVAWWALLNCECRPRFNLTTTTWYDTIELSKATSKRKLGGEWTNMRKTPCMRSL